MRRINDRKQQHLFDPWYFLSPKRRAMLDQQWPGFFRDHILDLLPVDKFALAFPSDMGRPTKELYTVLGALALQQFNTSILHAYGHSGQYPRFFLSLLLIDEAAKRPLSMAALRMCCSKTPWQLIQYVFKINHDISMQEIFCINCPATR
jgi:hypothetical protein